MFTVANIITGFNLLSGVASIIFAFSGRLELAVLAIILGAVFDFLDGFTARLLKQPSELGKQLDSLADIVTFGVAPGILVFILLILAGAEQQLTLQAASSTLWQGESMGESIQYWTRVYLNDLTGNSSTLPALFSGWNVVKPLFAFCIPFFSLFRLAKFNLDERQSMGFIGLPTPANSLFFASFALLLWDGYHAGGWKAEWSLFFIQESVLIPLVVLFSYLLIAELPLFSLKFSQFKWKGNEIKFIFLIISLIIILTLWSWAIPIVVLLYLILSVINNRILNK